jgi:hypothetical protein
MSRTQSMATLFAVTATLVLSLLAVSPAIAGTHDSSLRLRVGAGVIATVKTDSMNISCGDDAKCVFDVPVNSTFDVVARAPRGGSLQWTGCSSQPDANRCRVVMRSEAVLVTVR